LTDAALREWPKIRVDVPIGAVLPGDVDRPYGMADEQVFDFRAAVDEDRFGVRLQEGVGFGGFEMFHGNHRADSISAP
jgi:hypothetical protein